MTENMKERMKSAIRGILPAPPPVEVKKLSTVITKAQEELEDNKLDMRDIIEQYLNPKGRIVRTEDEIIKAASAVADVKNAVSILKVYDESTPTQGGTRKSIRRKRRKTNRRKTNRRKTNRRKTNRRKTNRRK
jgi:hypothetical protein